GKQEWELPDFIDDDFFLLSSQERLSQQPEEPELRKAVGENALGSDNLFSGQEYRSSLDSNQSAPVDAHQSGHHFSDPVILLSSSSAAAASGCRNKRTAEVYDSQELSPSPLATRFKADSFTPPNRSPLRLPSSSQI